MLLLRRALALGLAALAAASSTQRLPLRTIALAKNVDILTPDHRVTAVASFDIAFDVSAHRIRLTLEPNHDIFVEGGLVSYLAADGSIAHQQPIDRHQHKVYKGTAWLKKGKTWEKAGWARIGIRRDGLHPLFEGTFTMDRDHWHVKLGSSYQATRMHGDPEVPLNDDGDDEDMVVFKDSDMGFFGERQELRKRSEDLACTSDQLGFNTQDDHPVYASMRARDGMLMSSPFSNVFGKRQIDNQPGGNGAGVNLVSTIGKTTGCPTTRKVALVGVAADCTYITSFNGDRNRTQTNIIDQLNAASQLFETSFNISLGLANVVITEADCPTAVQQATPWNQACSGSLDIQARLNLFSQWRGQQSDTYSHWTLLTTCKTGSAVGLAWLGQACTSGSQPNPQSANEHVAGANVVVRTNVEWQVIAHETGHTYGAVHDCTSSLCANANTVSSQQCCPLSSSTCDANQRYIMNPSTSEGVTSFSPCSIGNVCSALGGNSVESSCLTDNRGITTITGQRCGNGIVEGDEECDCGGDQCGNNNCCNPTTCRFINNAVCDDSNADCCRNCQFASSTTVCRPSVGECDPSETCSGNSPYCPADKTEQDGTSCGNGLECASGQCTSRDLQCKTVMADNGQGNNTYACDSRNCMLSCVNPKLGSGTCFGLHQNFLDGTDCGGGGRCQNGQCQGGSVGGEIRSWIERNMTLVIGLSAGIGGFIVICILCCCVSSCRRRNKRRKYAAQLAQNPPQYRGRRGNGHDPMSSQGPLMSQNGYPMNGGGNENIPMAPPPLYSRNPVRYA